MMTEKAGHYALVFVNLHLLLAGVHSQGSEHVRCFERIDALVRLEK